MLAHALRHMARDSYCHRRIQAVAFAQGAATLVRTLVAACLCRTKEREAGLRWSDSVLATEEAMKVGRVYSNVLLALGWAVLHRVPSLAVRCEGRGASKADERETNLLCTRREAALKL